MKRIIRHGFALVAEKRNCYTRDLYPAYKEFSAVHPEKEREMYHALELAINPTDNTEEVFEIIDVLGEWIVVQHE